MRQGKEQVRQELQKDRLWQRANEFINKLVPRRCKQTKTDDRKKKLNDTAWIQQNLGADKYSREVAAMADPIAYYDIASSRIVDSIANHLEYGLLHGLEKDLKAKLFNGLQATDSGHCALLLAEDPSREELRRSLIEEKQKLLQASEVLQKLPQLT